MKKLLKRQIVDDSELWENGTLGQSEAHARPVGAVIDAAIDDALGLQPITIRLQKTLVEELKTMAKESGLGYQPFVRQLLTKYVSEQRRSKTGV